MATYGYLGPEATFTHQALRQLSQAVERGSNPGALAPVSEAVAFPDVLATLDAVSAGTVSAAVVPIENSIEGGVSATLDHLADSQRLRIIGEVLVPVSFVLAAQAGTALADIDEVLTHPVAEAQVRTWLSTHVSGVSVTHVGSTAAAAALLATARTADQRDSGSLAVSGHRAAICAKIAAEVNGLSVLAEGIADNAQAVTRFVVVSAGRSLPAPTGRDKTTMIIFQRDDHAGALQEILDQFSSRQISLTRLESRPTKTTLGSYCFSVDAEGHLLDARIAEALQGLHRISKEVRFLGSYPRADDQPVQALPVGASNAEHADAADWLAQLTTEPVTSQPDESQPDKQS